jgi:hypothetical protein
MQTHPQTENEIRAYEKDLILGAPLIVSPKIARSMLNIGQTKLYQLLAAHELQSYSEGKSRKIVVRSIHQYIQKKLKAA